MRTRVVTDSDGVVHVVVEGELDLLTAPELERAIARAGTIAERVVLDLSRVEFIDSSGFRTLLHATEAMPTLAVTDASAAVLRYATLTSTEPRLRL